MRGWLRGGGAARAPEVPAPKEPVATAPATEPTRRADPTAWVRGVRDPHVETAALLELLRATPPVDERAVLDALVAALEQGSARHDELRFETALRLDRRGDDPRIEGLLAPLLDLATERGSIDALLLVADIDERAGRLDRARLRYEQVLARDARAPRALERARRLASGAEPVMNAGATVVVGGQTMSERYRVERELGRGGAGTVFAAEDRTVGRTVALKLYHRRGAADRVRLLHEARVALELAHTSVVRVIDVDEALFALVMQLEAETPRARIERDGADDAALVALATDFATAVARVHERGFVHRDLKPSNVLLSPDGRVVLTDFGLAARAGDEQAQSAEGTYRFMAPEQRRAAVPAPPMDVFAWGRTVEAWCAAAAREVPVALRALVFAAVADDPALRPSMTMIRDELRAALP